MLVLLVAAPVLTNPLPAADVELIPLLEFPLDGMEDVVREAFESRQDAVAELAAAEPRDPARLASAYADLGQLTLSYDRRLEAEICFKNAERLTPLDFRWPYSLGALYQNDQRPEDAIAALERTLELRPQYPPALMRLGEAHLQLRQLSTAEEFFRAALSHGEGYAASAHYGLGRVMDAREDPAAAVEHYARALELQPRATALNYSLGLAYRGAGDLDKAREFLRQAGQLRPRFLDPLVQNLVAEGAVANMQRGLAAANRGQFELAAEYHQKAVEADPDNPTVRRELAEALLKLGQHDRAIAEHRQVLELQPKSPLAHLALAFALTERDGPVPEVLELAKKALELAPDYADAHAFLGRQYEIHGDPEAARAAYALALEADPEHLVARQGRARWRGLAGEVDAAVAELEDVIEKAPENLDAVLDLATLLARAGRAEEAIGRLESLLGGSAAESFPAPARALLRFNLANLLQEAGRDADAIAEYDRVIELEEEYGDAHFNRAALLLRVGRAADAARAFERAVELAPSDARAHLARARALAAAGQPLAARGAYEDALAAVPNDPALMNGLARLLATSPEAAVRDGERAHALARAALAAASRPEYAETVAMALAELGRFEEAAQWQRGILEQARRAGAPAGLLESLGARLELYAAGRPYREALP